MGSTARRPLFRLARGVMCTPATPEGYCGPRAAATVEAELNDQTDGPMALDDGVPTNPLGPGSRLDIDGNGVAPSERGSEVGRLLVSPVGNEAAAVAPLLEADD
jgi:hypothetical protein